MPSSANLQTSSSGSVTSLPSGTLRSWTVGALPIINRLLARMNLEGLLQSHLPARDGRSKVPVAHGLVVLVQNLLLAREPLYGIRDWAAGQEPELLGLTADQIGVFNDDRIGRCLSALFQADRTALLLAVVRHVVREFGVSLEELHNDSTTVSFYGAYADAGEEHTVAGQTTPAITWGHSKAHRPDLKQLLYVLTLSSDGGVPIHCRVASGNVTDDTTHRDNWETLRQIAGTSDFLYVADCKLVTRENLAYIDSQGGRFVSVLPRTRREDAQFRERLRTETVSWQPIWDKCDDEGQLADRFSAIMPHETLPEGYRLWWYHSTRKAELDRASRRSRLDRAVRHLCQLQNKLRGPRSRQRDRVKLLERIQEILDHYDVAELMRIEVLERSVESFRQKHRGRPGKETEYVKRVQRRLDLEFSIDPAAVAEAQKTDGIFPLVTNEPSLDALGVLHAYKRQPTIEKRFEQMKTDFAVAPVWLKDVKRIDALLHVYFFVLLTQALLERELRQAMQRKQIETLPLYPEGRPCRCPTARRVIDVFENVQRHELETPNGTTTSAVTKLTPLQRKLLGLFRMPPSDYEA